MSTYRNCFSVAILLPLAAPLLHADDWPLVRGDPALTGVVKMRLPTKPELLWRHTLPDAVSATAAIAKGIVYVASEDGFVTALRLTDGSVRWRRKIAEIFWAAPTVVDGGLYVGDDDGKVHALDAATGAARWRFETQGSIYSSVNWTRDPAGRLERLIVGSYDGTLYCLDLAGKLRWKATADDRIHGTPGIFEGYTGFAGCDAAFHLIRLADGVEVSAVDVGAPCASAAAYRNGLVVIPTHGNQVVGISLSKLIAARSARPTSHPVTSAPATSQPAGPTRKAIAWRFEDRQRPFPYVSSAALTADLAIVAGRDKRVRAIALDTGRQRWAVATAGRIESSPIVADQTVFVGAEDGVLYGLALDDGRERWRYETGAPLTASPAVAEGRLVIANADGLVFCFGEKNE